MNPVSPLEQAKGILGEHFQNYVIIVQPAEDPTFFDVVGSDPFATTGLLQSSVEYHKSYMDAGIVDDDAIVWTEEEEEEDTWEDEE